MSNGAYWGEAGQFGPFDIQEDGWPNAGQVMRYFREKLGMTAKTFGILYGKKVRENGKPICERWILEMELENKVPTDIVRRRIIASLLHIPPILFGLASLEEIAIQPRKEISAPSVVTQTSTLQRVSTDITKYEKNIRVALQLHKISSAQGVLKDVNTDIRDLENLEGQVKGDLLYQVRELLVGNGLLATKIVKDQRQYALAYNYANNAVRVAKNLEDEELLASARYTRGCTKLEWGLFGTQQQGRFQFNDSRIKGALRDFQDVLDTTRARQKAIHPQLHGFALLQLSRAQCVLNSISHNAADTNSLAYADQAADMVGCETIDDSYTRILVTGTLSGLHLGGYHLVRAGIFNAAGLPGKAITELNQLKHLTERTYGQDETRNQAWSDIVWAETFMRLEEYPQATGKTKEALIACHNINSIQNVTMIADIYNRLTASSYGASEDAQELGDMLAEWFE